MSIDVTPSLGATGIPGPISCCGLGAGADALAIAGGISVDSHTSSGIAILPSTEGGGLLVLTVGCGMFPGLVIASMDSGIACAPNAEVNARNQGCCVTRRSIGVAMVGHYANGPASASYIGLPVSSC